LQMAAVLGQKSTPLPGTWNSIRFDPPEQPKLA
jgi:hypothetical protein